MAGVFLAPPPFLSFFPFFFLYLNSHNSRFFPSRCLSSFVPFSDIYSPKCICACGVFVLVACFPLAALPPDSSPTPVEDLCGCTRQMPSPLRSVSYRRPPHLHPWELMRFTIESPVQAARALVAPQVSFISLTACDCSDLAPPWHHLIDVLHLRYDATTSINQNDDNDHQR